LRGFILKQWQSFVEDFPVFFEEIFGEVKYGIGDEKSGNDVNGVMDVRHKDDRAEKY
jgi:hypothetical protein